MEDRGAVAVDGFRSFACCMKGGWKELCYEIAGWNQYRLPRHRHVWIGYITYVCACTAQSNNTLHKRDKAFQATPIYFIWKCTSSCNTCSTCKHAALPRFLPSLPCALCRHAILYNTCMVTRSARASRQVLRSADLPSVSSASAELSTSI